MTRIDDLLQQAIATGAIPAEATELERAELQPLLHAARSVGGARPRVEAEASASMPIARARFERYIAAQQAPASPTPRSAAVPSGRGFFHRIIQHHRGLVLSGAAVAIGLVAVVAIGISQLVLSDTESAAAQVLTPDDYVQVQGVVQDVAVNGDLRTIQLRSDLATVQVTLGADTSVVDAGAAIEVSAIQPGDQLLVGGVVGTNRQVAANTVARSQAPKPLPKVIKFKTLRKLLPNLEGRVSLFAVAKDGRARVLIDAADGQRYLVYIDAKTAELLVRLRSALGAQVRVTAGDNPNDATFALSLAEPASPSVTPPTSPSPSSIAGGAARPDTTQANGTPGFMTVRGVVIAREANVLQVLTRDGRVPVAVRPATRRFWGESGLDSGETANPDALIGHTVSVTGGLDARTGRVVADTIVVGPRAR